MEKKSLLLEQKQKNIPDGFSYEALTTRQIELFNKIEKLWQELSNNERRQIIHVIFKNSVEDGLSFGQKLRFTKDQYRDGVLGPRFVYAHPEVQKKMTDLVVLENKFKVSNSEDKYFADKLMAVEDMYMNGVDKGTGGNTEYDRKFYEKNLEQEFKDNSLSVKQLVNDFEELYGDFLAVSVMSEPVKKEKKNKKILVENNRTRENRRLSPEAVAENNLLRIGEAMLIKEKKDKTGEKLTDREKPLDVVYKTEKKIAEQKLIKEIEAESGLLVTFDLKEGKYITKEEEKTEEKEEEKTQIESGEYRYKLMETDESPVESWSDASYYRFSVNTVNILANEFFNGDEALLRGFINAGIHVYSRPVQGVDEIGINTITKDLSFFIDKITGDKNNTTDTITSLLYDNYSDPYIVATTKNNDYVIYDRQFTVVHRLVDHKNLVTFFNDFDYCKKYGRDTISVVEKKGNNAIEYVYQKEKIAEVEEKDSKYTYLYQERGEFNLKKYTNIEPSLDQVIKDIQLEVSDEDKKKCFFTFLNIGGTPTENSIFKKDLESFIPIAKKLEFKIEGVFYDAEENPYFSCVRMTNPRPPVAQRFLYDRYGEKVHEGYDRLNNVALDNDNTGQYMRIVSNDIKDTDFNEPKYYEYFYKRIENKIDQQKDQGISKEEMQNLVKYTFQLAGYLKRFYKENVDFDDIVAVLDIAKYRSDTEEGYKEMKAFLDPWEKTKPIDMFYENMLKNIDNKYLLELAVYEFWTHHTKYEIYQDEQKFGIFLKDLIQSKVLFNLDDNRPVQGLYSKSRDRLIEIREKIWSMIEHMIVFGKPEKNEIIEKKSLKQYELIQQHERKYVSDEYEIQFKKETYYRQGILADVFDEYKDNFEFNFDLLMSKVRVDDDPQVPSDTKLKEILKTFFTNCPDVVKNKLKIDTLIIDNVGDCYFFIENSLLDSKGTLMRQYDRRGRVTLCMLHNTPNQNELLIVHRDHHNDARQHVVVEERFKVSEQAEKKEIHEKPTYKIEYLHELTPTEKRKAPFCRKTTFFKENLAIAKKYSKNFLMDIDVVSSGNMMTTDIKFIEESLEKFIEQCPYIVENKICIDAVLVDCFNRSYFLIDGRQIVDTFGTEIRKSSGFMNIDEIYNQNGNGMLDANFLTFEFETLVGSGNDKDFCARYKINNGTEKLIKNNNELSEDKKDCIRLSIAQMYRYIKDNSKTVYERGEISMARLYDALENYTETKKEEEKKLFDFFDYVEAYPEYIFSLFDTFNSLPSLQEHILKHFAVYSAFRNYSDPIQTAQEIKNLVESPDLFIGTGALSDKEFVLSFVKKLEEYGKQQSLTPEQKKIEPKLKLLNMVHDPELADIKSYFKEKWGEVPFEEEEEFSVEKMKEGMKKYLTMDAFKRMVKVSTKTILDLHPKDLLGFMSAKKDTSSRLLAERLVEKTFPESWKEYRAKISNASNFNFKRSPITAEAYLNGSYTSAMEGGDPLETEDKELFRLRKPIGEMLVSDIYNSYNTNAQEWEKLEIPLYPDLGIETEEITIEIPDVFGMQKIRLTKTIDSEILEERIKGIDGKGTEILLKAVTNSLGEVDIEIPKGVVSVLYSLEKNTLPSIPTDIPQEEYLRFSNTIVTEYSEKVNQSIIELPVEMEAFLLSIDPLSPKNQVIAIESFVRDISYYDFNNKETQDTKRGKTMDERFMLMEMRMNELKLKDEEFARQTVDKKYAGVCADFAELTTALLRRKGFISGTLTGFRPNNNLSVGTLNAHGASFVVFPDEKGRAVPYMVDGTPGGVTTEEKKKLQELGISKPSIQEREGQIEEKKEEIKKEGEKQIKELEELIKNGDQKAIAELANGKLEKVLNTVLRYEVNKSHANTLTRVLNAYWYTPFSKELETLDTKLERKKFFFDEIKNVQSVENTSPAGTELFNTVRTFAQKIEKEQKLDKHSAFEKLETVFIDAMENLSEIEKRAITVIIAYLKADSMKGRKPEA